MGVGKSLLSPTFLIDLMETQRYGVEYQPIVDVRSQDIYAYECLARFYDADDRPVPPDVVYASLHQSPLSLFQVEYQQKKLQLSNAPGSEKLFVNLDQDSYFSAGEEDVANNPFVDLFSADGHPDITVELIENSEINDAVMSLAMISDLSRHGIDTAIDDVCNPQSMVSTSVLQLVDFIKLDKHVVRSRDDTNFQCLVRSLIDYAQATGRKVILEGVETESDLAFARRLNVDLVQGYWYSDTFVSVR